ncbi:MAG: RNase H family protein [bacterium]|nr:RNase H family protein [bacterium]
MANPYAVQIHCDGAMDYDSKQTGGNGFIIEFPDVIGVEPITRAIRNDEQGVHRLEMISLIEAMEELLAFGKQNPDLLRKAAAVEIFTDRLHVTDSELTSPYRIRDWRKNGWKNYEGKPIKDKDLLDRIDKTRVKVGQAVGGRVSIQYVREKKNKVADKLSRDGRRSDTRGRKIIDKKKRRVIRRLYDGPEMKYLLLSPDEEMEVRLYAWEPVGKQCEVCFEICSGDHEGRIVKAYVNIEQKTSIHRGHRYRMIVNEVFTHHITTSSLEEVIKSTKSKEP